MSLHAEVRVDVGGFEVSIDLDVADGEIVGVLGPNGAGKTTLLRTLAGFEPLTCGCIILDGDVLDDPQADTFVAPRVRPSGLVPQDLALFGNLSVLDNVAFGLRARGEKRTQARQSARMWLARVGMDDRAGSRPAELSGGEAQRVAIARTLATEPRLVLLDEPMAALDAEAKKAMRVELKEILGSVNALGVLVTHDLADALALADRVVVLEHGRVSQTDTPTGLMQAPATHYVVELVRAAGNFVDPRSAEVRTNG